VATGKTHLAAAIANELIDSLYTVIFGNVTDIITLIKSSYGKTELDESEIINTITDIDLLIIDDLGKEYATENTRMLLYQIINRLYENEKPVIITTNLNSDALAAKYGDRGAAIVSRITEMCDPVTLDGNDWRIRRQL
jgi:DNA replication protein DnaC